MTVAAILAGKGRHVVTMSPQQSLADVCEILSANRIGAVVLTDPEGRIAGILSERDIVRALSQEGPGVLQTKADAHMSRKVVTATEHETALEVLHRMSDGRFRHMPIVRDSRLIGVISIGDVVQYRLELIEREAQQLREYIAAG